MSYIVEFLGLMAVFFIFIVVPGADFAVILRQSIVHGRRAASMTGLGMATALGAWFAGVSYFFTAKTIRDRFIASGKWFNRITGAALVGFGFRLALSRAAD
ncbi:hypothetical protein CO652_12855 [Rhizobium sp. H4]|uniref:hypothetical protein n=1 Tax=Rhizobium TaxID=379 RepID=UPI000BE9E385|nr:MULTISPECIES: hypothetical protein [Rhizobium]PDV88031.1 hypothetical protein CO652_12855 [Rhizobium sp. H4]WET73376.1 hypothetical protein PYR68_18400 [Rhizobium croatiense]